MEHSEHTKRSDGNRLSVRNGRKTGNLAEVCQVEHSVSGRWTAETSLDVSHRSRKSGISGIWRMAQLFRLQLFRSSVVGLRDHRPAPRSSASTPRTSWSDRGINVQATHVQICCWKAEKRDRVRNACTADHYCTEIQDLSKALWSTEEGSLGSQGFLLERSGQGRRDRIGIYAAG